MTMQIYSPTSKFEALRESSKAMRIDFSPPLPVFLFRFRYARDVKRQKLDDRRAVEVIDYLMAACPVRSGSRHVTYQQYITDDALYQGYRTTTQHPVCFNTFYKLKKFMRVRKKMRYFGMFDCPLCYRLDHIPSEYHSLPPDDFAGRLKLGIEYSECKKHQQLHFPSAVSTP
jgi:hypothetical protein